ncbi:MAG: hypothetical protein L6R39_000992 [Caloplaca ligustica]|nr:MAG: hypothetical protein L6R39_000992 [Caloplaca ligustica]
MPEDPCVLQIEATTSVKTRPCASQPPESVYNKELWRGQDHGQAVSAPNPGGHDPSPSQQNDPARQPKELHNDGRLTENEPNHSLASTQESVPAQRPARYRKHEDHGTSEFDVYGELDILRQSIKKDKMLRDQEIRRRVEAGQLKRVQEPQCCGCLGTLGNSAPEPLVVALEAV